MIQKLKSIILTLASMSLVLAPTLAMAPIAAAATPDINSGLCCGTDLNVSQCSTQTCADSASRGQLQNLLTNVINIFSIIVGVVAVVMIIVGGLRYITSGGDSGKVSGAKTTLIYALIGLVIVAFAQLIVHYVLGQAQAVISGGSGA